jgi:trk system potassium uptake protein TrkA
MPRDLRVVVAGAGRVGERTARLLDERGHDVAVIDPDADRADEMSDAYVATVINGDATRPSVLRQARVGDADVVAALTAVPGVNLAICTIARHYAPGVETVMRVDEEPGDEYDEFVDEIVFPERAGARAAANAIEPDVRALEDATGSLDIFEVTVTEEAPVAGRSLTEVAFPSGSLVVSDADSHAVAGPETTLEPGHRYTVAAEPAVTDEVMALLRG